MTCTLGCFPCSSQVQVLPKSPQSLLRINTESVLLEGTPYRYRLRVAQANKGNKPKARCCQARVMMLHVLPFDEPTRVTSRIHQDLRSASSELMLRVLGAVVEGSRQRAAAPQRATGGGPHLWWIRIAHRNCTHFAHTCVQFVELHTRLHHNFVTFASCLHHIYIKFLPSVVSIHCLVPT